MTIREKEDALFAALRESDPGIVADGLSCEGEYLRAPVKIVYVLKEVNGGSGWDLRDFVRQGGRAQTWNVVARWTEALLDPDAPQEWAYWAGGNEERRKKYLPMIGAVNLKKTSGGHTAVGREIEQAADAYHETVAAQMELYAPDILVCCGTSSAFCAHCRREQARSWMQTTRGVWYVDDGSTLLLSYAHPEARIADNILHYALVDAVKEIWDRRKA